MRAIVTAIVFFKQRTVCIINVWGRAEILPRRKNFRTAPYINYACVLLSSKTMTYSQVYWIYTLLIDTYFINKNGFRCVRLFSLSALRFPSFFSVSFHSPSRFCLPRPFSPFFFSLFIPQQASNSLPSSYLWITCPSAIPLHHGDLLKFARW